MIAAAFLAPEPCLTVTLAWRGNRFLAPEDEPFLEARCPPDIEEALGASGVVGADAALAAAVGAGDASGHARLYLVLLEDLLRGFLENGRTGKVRQRLEDPAAPVRLRALELLWAAAEIQDQESLLAVLSGLDSRGRLSFALWAARDLEPAAAGELLTGLQDLFGQEDDYLSAWVALATGMRPRSPRPCAPTWPNSPLRMASAR